MAAQTRELAGGGGTGENGNDDTSTFSDVEPTVGTAAGTGSSGAKNPAIQNHDQQHPDHPDFAANPSGSECPSSRPAHALALEVLPMQPNEPKVSPVTRKNPPRRRTPLPLANLSPQTQDTTQDASGTHGAQCQGSNLFFSLTETKSLPSLSLSNPCDHHDFFTTSSGRVATIPTIAETDEVFSVAAENRSRSRPRIWRESQRQKMDDDQGEANPIGARGAGTLALGTQSPPHPPQLVPTPTRATVTAAAAAENAALETAAPQRGYDLISSVSSPNSITTTSPPSSAFSPAAITSPSPASTAPDADAHVDADVDNPDSDTNTLETPAKTTSPTPIAGGAGGSGAGADAAAIPSHASTEHSIIAVAAVTDNSNTLPRQTAQPAESTQPTTTTSTAAAATGGAQDRGNTSNSSSTSPNLNLNITSGTSSTSSTSSTSPGSRSASAARPPRRLEATTSQQEEEEESRPSSNPHSTSPNLSRNAATTPADCNTSPTKVIRPAFTRPRNLSQLSHPSQLSQPVPKRPPLSRASSTRSVCSAPLQHPTPELNARSGAYVGNVAALEATAERFSMTSSIEDAIREAHAELKRSDSQRSAILASSVRNLETSSVAGESAPVPPFSRQLSIVSLNSAARSGGYSPSGYVMSPSHSFTANRLRSGSKASSTGAPAFISGSISSSPPPMPETHASAMSNAGTSAAADGEGGSIAFLSRHGPGKSSIRSARSNTNGPSLAGIAEVELPLTLTQDALDEADRLTSSGDERGDDDTIRPSALQLAHMGFDGRGHLDLDLTPSAADWMRYPSSPGHHEGFGYDQQWQSGSGARSGYQMVSQQDAPYSPDLHDDRPGTAASNTTFNQAQSAFGDFDGVHCDPDLSDFPGFSAEEALAQAEALQAEADAQAAFARAQSDAQAQTLAQEAQDQVGPAQGQASAAAPAPDAQPEVQQRPLRRPPRRVPTERPKSYFDHNLGQEMIYYPARVPAMLNLPPKLSKKPKAAARNEQQSRVLNAMAQPPPERQSRLLLPDPLEAGFGAPLMELDEPRSRAGSGGSGSGSLDKGKQPEQGVLPEIREPEAARLSSHDDLAAMGDTHHPGQPRELRRPQKLTEAERRQSRMSMLPGDLPPQLRASAFFDLPPTSSPNLELKGGSAMATLDSILDASASAPVSAFTDHTFAGKLGSEVYGAEKKAKKKQKKLSVDNRPSAVAAADRELKTKSSFLSLVGGAHKRNHSDAGNSTTSSAGDKRATTMLGPSSSDPNARPLNRTSTDGSGAIMAPDADEALPLSEDEDQEEDEEEPLYQGAPTTLLAELQLRKHQQKLRTRPITQAHPNGLHTTLLELDAVAEVERKARKGKRVNLAWEDPALARDDGSDDEDVPLAMLQVMRGVGPNGDISAVAAEINRPLGLMERRDLEDNEPLSRRRDRLQGREPDTVGAAGVYLNPAGPTRNTLANLSPNRASVLTLTPNGPGPTPVAALSRNSHMPTASQSQIQLQLAPQLDLPEDEEEIEDEPLGDRRRRLKALGEDNPLPLATLARPVSGAFSVELLSQFGDLDKDNKENETSVDDKKKLGQQKRPGTSGSLGPKSAITTAVTVTPAAGAGAGGTGAPEEEETLGQRRRRLQAEKEAREREMGTGGVGTNAAALEALTAGAGNNRMSKKLSMADVLGAHPASAARGAMDPREAERLRVEAEAARFARERDEKLRAHRAMMRSSMLPASPSTPGGGVGGGLGGAHYTHQASAAAGGGGSGMMIPASVGVPTAMGIGAVRTVSGFAGGRYNDGMGGGAALPIGAARDGPGVGAWGRQSYFGGGVGVGVTPPGYQTTATAAAAQATGIGMGAGGYGFGAVRGGGGGYGASPGMGMAGYGAGVGAGGGGMGMGMVTSPAQMQMMQMQNAAQSDMVERWRQGVMP